MKTFCPNKNLYTNVYNSFIQNSQKIETMQMIINWWMDKQNTVRSYSGIVFGTKEWSTDMYHNLDEPGKHYPKGMKPATKIHLLLWFQSYNSPEQENLETEGRFMIAWWGMG